MGYTILAANYFMEIWLSPALGFDYAQRKVVLFGDGRALISWVSYRDVAEVAVRSHLTPGARNRTLDVGGPQDLSPLEVVRIFEKVSGAPFERQFVPEEALLTQLDHAADPLSETFVKLQLEYVHGCPMNTSETLRPDADGTDYRRTVRRGGLWPKGGERMSPDAANSIGAICVGDFSCYPIPDGDLLYPRVALSGDDPERVA